MKQPRKLLDKPQYCEIEKKCHRIHCTGWNSICKYHFWHSGMQEIVLIYTCPINVSRACHFFRPFPHFLGCPNDMEPMNSFMMWTVASAESGRTFPPAPRVSPAESQWVISEDNYWEHAFQEFQVWLYAWKKYIIINIYIYYVYYTYIYISTKPNNAHFFLANHSNKHHTTCSKAHLQLVTWQVWFPF